MRTTFLVQGKSGDIADVFECPIAAIAIEIPRRGVVGDNQIKPTVIIDIGERRPESVVEAGIRNTRFYAHVGEGPVAVVMEKMVLLSVQTARTAHHALSSVPAGLALHLGTARYGGIIKIKLDITGDEKIEAAIAVVVAERCACGPASQRDASSFADVSKSSIVVVMIQVVLAKIGYVYVRPAVVVEIAHRDAESPSIVGRTGSSRDIRKSPVMIVMEQSSPRGWSLPFSAVEVPAIQQVNVRPAVVVIV